MKKTIVVQFVLLTATILVAVVPGLLRAQVTGPCNDCHTMHNSQGGDTVVQTSSEETSAQSTLLVSDCLGCHSSAVSSEWKSSVGAPIVYNMSPPSYGATSDGGSNYQGLAGGNFYWVQTDDNKGHNIFASNPDTLTTAPGGVAGPQGVGCGTNSCHDNLHAPYSDSVVGLQGRQGCTKCHMIDDINQPKGFHHADDSASLVIDGPPWYRFLKGHNAIGSGVSGLEDQDWEHNASSTGHNEYLGQYEEGGNDADSWSLTSRFTMTAYCSGCHGNFHVQESNNAWVRHPSDAVLPTGTPPTEYQGYTVYNPLVPVARPELSEDPIAVVTAGSDMVMCLSCHRPHGSPYDDMLRWDYTTMQAGGGSNTNGCFACHTTKDDGA